ncbi:superoxide dismutase family protein [Actinopolyspora mortivallis]|uniref:Superoxide dismutase n=1 Tax=Actinopolyspora mortivallis TaxID=33906 RepID=A0A2T0GSA8_ACTMO|nr:superoxide dismutase family protein [Actinopolyspora mortivallis]PRW62002.1 superoxide dismutase [Actinopolyspora mortivallis]
MRRFAITSAVALAVLSPAAPAAAHTTGSTGPTVAHGVFEPYTEEATAVTYSPEKVPVGAGARLFSDETPGAGRTVLMSLRGLLPDREYGAHVHTSPCGRTGSAAGPHFQQRPAPEGVSGDPEYANPRNEVWLDFRTDDSGNALTGAFGDWDLERAGSASVVIHQHHTRTAPGVAGEAGQRLACLNVVF